MDKKNITPTSIGSEVATVGGINVKPNTAPGDIKAGAGASGVAGASPFGVSAPGVPADSDSPATHAAAPNIDAGRNPPAVVAHPQSGPGPGIVAPAPVSVTVTEQGLHDATIFADQRVVQRNVPTGKVVAGYLIITANGDLVQVSPRTLTIVGGNVAGLKPGQRIASAADIARKRRDARDDQRDDAAGVIKTDAENRVADDRDRKKASSYARSTEV